MKAATEAKGYHSFIGQVYSDLEEFVLRKGKRLASCRTLLTCKGYTGKVDDNILNVCDLHRCSDIQRQNHLQLPRFVNAHLRESKTAIAA